MGHKEVKMKNVKRKREGDWTELKVTGQGKKKSTQETF